MKKIFVLLLSLILLCSCGASDDTYNESDNGRDDIVYYDDTNKGLNSDFVETPETNATTDEARKVIETYSVQMEAKDYDKALSGIKGQVDYLDGYIQSSNEYTNAYNNIRNITMTIRIPSGNSDGFIEYIGSYGTITRISQDKNDITSQYQDIEMRLETLYVQENTYLELLEKASSIDEVLKINDYLSNVRYEIESYETRIKNYDLLVNYDTVTITIYEVEKETPTSTPSILQSIKDVFTASLTGIVNILRTIVIFILGNVLYILLVLALLFGFYKLVKYLLKNKYLSRKTHRKSQKNINIEEVKDTPNKE